METEVTVNYSKSCLGEGSKGKLEFLDTVMGLLCDQADWNVGTRPLHFSSFGL